MINQDTFVRFFTGESSDREKEAIRQWLDSSEENKRIFINERIRFDASLIVNEKEIIPRKSTGLLIWNNLKIASIIILLIGSGYLLRKLTYEMPPISNQSIQVPAGNRTSLYLPDGTLVWLNSNSTLHYPNIFSNGKRIVELNGEAYFDVTADKEKPFIIKTSKYNVEVLGTTLNVDAYTNRPTFSTTLFTGKVRLYKECNEKEGICLSKGETAELIDGHLRVSSGNSETFRWRDGLLVIENKSFEEIMALFEKYYAQTIIIRNNKLKDLGYNGKLRVSDGVDHALRVLQKDFHFTYERDEDINRIYIY